MRRLRKRYGRASGGDKKTVSGKLTYVNTSSGEVTIAGDDGHEHKARIMSARYWAAGSQSQAWKAALRTQKLVGRHVTAHMEYHNAFGWAIFGGSNIRLSK